MRLLITGASGQLGSHLLREGSRRKLEIVAWSGSRGGRLFGFQLERVDLAKPEQIVAAFTRARPTAVIHAAALSAVAACYRQPKLAEQINTRGTAVLAEQAARTGARLVYVSTDLVFDGE